VTAKRVLLLVLGVTGLSLGVGFTVAVKRAEPRLRQEVVRALEARMDAAVTLETLTVRMWPRPMIAGGGLTIRHRQRTDLPPLIVIREFSGDASWSGIFSASLNAVMLDGLEITIPPRRRQDMPDLVPGQNVGDDGERDRSRFGIANLTATNARLTILPGNPEKDPRVFDIHSLQIDNLTLQTPSRFVASITNPIPVGRIETSGSFGPWNGEEPGDTPLDGQFQFDADLGTIKGIAGALHANGAFEGILDRLAVKGTTETPDFSIPKLKAASVPLATTFQAVVDGTNGDVQLEQVDVRLGDSPLIAKGFIVGTKGVKGKRVLLDVTATRARIEDMLRLTVRTTPPMMRGALALTTSFDLPQGDADVIDKLRLGGTVTITNAHFASDAVQGKVDALSRRSSGRPQDQSVRNVPSTVKARFTLADGVLTLQNVNYDVNGAAIALHGRYELEPGQLNLEGTVRLHATVSETQTGMRHFLLKPFDAMFRKGGAGTRLAITITGSVESPKVGIDLRRSLKGK
jgi:hypothetical protein